MGNVSHKFPRPGTKTHRIALIDGPNMSVLVPTSSGSALAAAVGPTWELRTKAAMAVILAIIGWR